MPLTKLEGELRPVARERIENGRLPPAVPRQVVGGDGSGQPCALCDKVITRDEIELEIRSRDPRFPDPLRFHVVCESIWQLECARADYLKRNPPG